MIKYDVIIVGAGFAGAVLAERLAHRDKQVLVIDSREQIGGNAYDYMQDGILIHKYGPHIFHTNYKEVFDYLSNFTKWYKYEHKVVGHIKDKVVPIPFNLESIEECFDQDKSVKLKAILKQTYGDGKRVPIMELLKNEDEDIKELADFIFENVFKYYTMKQWGLEADELDSAVTARVPVNVSYDDRYFNDEYQYMPKEGYTKIFEKLLENENIELRLNTYSKDLISLKNGKIFFDGELFEGKLIYTGAIDELFDYSLGELPYRSLDLKLERKDGTYQKKATENYPCPKEERAYTRITEYKHFMENEIEDLTYIHIEYPMAYDRNAQIGNIPYYPVFTEENDRRYKSYVELANNYENLILIGRLAEYRYYNMDAIVKKALEVASTL